MMRQLANRVAGLVATLLPMVPSGVEARTVPPDAVSTVYVSSTQQRPAQAGLDLLPGGS